MAILTKFLVINKKNIIINVIDHKDYLQILKFQMNLSGSPLYLHVKYRNLYSCQQSDLFPKFG